MTAVLDAPAAIRKIRYVCALIGSDQMHDGVENVWISWWMSFDPSPNATPQAAGAETLARETFGVASRGPAPRGDDGIALD